MIKAGNRLGTRVFFWAANRGREFLQASGDGEGLCGLGKAESWARGATRTELMLVSCDGL